MQAYHAHTLLSLERVCVCVCMPACMLSIQTFRAMCMCNAAYACARRRYAAGQEALQQLRLLHKPCNKRTGITSVDQLVDKSHINSNAQVTHGMACQPSYTQLLHCPGTQ